MFHYMTYMCLLYLVGVQALIGYDCGSRQLNVTTMSLIDVGSCDIPEVPVNVTRTYMQLLQLDDYRDTVVIQCKLEVHRTIYYCGMNSHNSIVMNGENEYIQELSRQQCKTLHSSGLYLLPNGRIIEGIKVNHTISHPIVFAGFLNGDGKCKGIGYTDPYGSWENVVVQGTLKITLSEYTARVQLNQNQINLRSGTACTLSETSCLDITGGYTFWDPIPIDNCRFQQYSVLYEGYASKVTDFDTENHQYVYTLSAHDITFALTSRGKESVCGYTITKTEHPKLLIFETTKGDTFAEKNKVSVSNLDIFAYVNSKFVYVEKHIRSQMKSLYRDVITQRCNLERQTLKNSLSIATQNPDNFAYDLMKGPGYMAVAAGEVVHIIKCVPVEVKIEHTEGCYLELPVSRQDHTYYLTPRTHILKSKGTKTLCNSLLPAYYAVGDTWYKITPRPIEARPPLTLKPLTKPTWTYIQPAELATSGIYTEKDLQQLRERIMFPVERSAMLNDLAREMRVNTISDNDGTIMKLLNPEVLEKIVDSAWGHIWGKFMTFGTASAGLIAIWLLLNIVKAVVDVIIKGIALHSVYGWSVYILCAIWSSVTYMLLHKHRSKEEGKNTGGTELLETQEAQPLQGSLSPKPSPKPTQRKEVEKQKGRQFLDLNV